MEPQTTKTTPKKTARVSRSISLAPELYTYLQQRAKEMDRSVNWLVNQLVAKDLKNAR